MKAAILVPSQLSNYIFRGTIGEGAFSVVKLAEKKSTKELLACKIVPRSTILSADTEERFETEIRINQQMHHPGIVRILDLLKDDVNYYIFMEYCAKGELFQYIIQKGRISEEEAAIIIKQILFALSHLHKLGVAHRDLKPENILITENNQFKISDFGLSRFVGENGLVKTSCGSPVYASPECLSGKPYDGRMSDMWSLGVISYAMVCGKLPWGKTNQARLFQQIKTAKFNTPNYLSDNCVSFIRSLITVKPLDRMSAAVALKHAFVFDVQISQIASNSSFKVLSLKTVDKFFNDDGSALPSAVNDNFEMNSQRPMNIMSVSRSITRAKYSSANAFLLAPTSKTSFRNSLNFSSFQRRPLKGSIISPSIRRCTGVQSWCHK